MPKKKNPEKTKKPQFVHFVENKCEKKELEEYRKKDKEKLNIKKLVLRIRKYEDLIDDEARNYANSFASNMPEAESEENNELIERINFWDKEIHKFIKEMNLIKDANYYYDATVKYDAEDPLHPEPEERVNVALFKGLNNINEIADTLEEWTPNRKKVTAEDLEEVKVNLFNQLTKA